MLLLRQPELEKQLATLRYQLPQLQKSLPTERQVADLLSRINMVIQSENTLLQEFVPQPSIPLEVMQVVPVRVVAYGIGESLAQFPNRLAKLSRQVNLKNFEIVALDNNERWRLTGTIQAYTQLSLQPASLLDGDPTTMLLNPAVVSVSPVQQVSSGGKP
jgi:Tfp pilus assembly protein PilO